MILLIGEAPVPLRDHLAQYCAAAPARDFGIRAQRGIVQSLP
jgi:hypothetical protein